MGRDIWPGSPPGDPKLRLKVRSTTLTSDAGLLLPRELDERLGLNTLMGRPRTDPRTGHNRQFPLRDLFRQPIETRTPTALSDWPRIPLPEAGLP